MQDTFCNLRAISDAEGGFISLLDTCSLGVHATFAINDEGDPTVAMVANRFVTAARSSNKGLRISVWEVAEDGAIQLRGAGQAEDILAVSVAALGTRRFVTAVQQANKTLKLSAWLVADDGTATLQGSATAGEVSAVSIAAVGGSRVVTAVRQADETLKLISWQVTSAGEIKRLNEIAAGKIVRVAICTVPPGSRDIVATAVQMQGAALQDFRLKVIAWKVHADGRFTRLGDAEGGMLTGLDMAAVSHERIVTCMRRAADAKLELIAWDVDQNGKVTEHSRAEAGEVGDFSIAALAATRVVTAVVQGNGTLKLIAWDAVDELIRLGDAVRGPADLVSTCVLEDYRIVTAMRQADETLKIILWNDQAVPLLHTEWKLPLTLTTDPIVESVQPLGDRYAFMAEERADTALAVQDQLKAAQTKLSPLVKQSPAPTLVFEPGIEGVDPMLAVGHKFVIVSQAHWLAFYEKKGNSVDLLRHPSGNPLKMTATEFFAGFITDKTGSGKVNQHNINRHLGVRTDIGVADECDPATGTNPCIDEFYDVRVHYDPTVRRFIVASAVRPFVWFFGEVGKENVPDKASPGKDPLVRRYVALAVSKSEDPRDGFHQYMTVESNYSDFPYVVSNDGLVIVTHSSKESKRDGAKPVAYIFSLADLAAGKIYPASHKIYKSSLFGNLRPMRHHGPQDNRHYFLSLSKSNVIILSFKTPLKLTEAPVFQDTSVKLGYAPGNPLVNVIYRNGHVYFTCNQNFTGWLNTSTEGEQPFYAVRVVRIPVAKDAQGAPMAIQSGVFDKLIMTRDPFLDAPDDVISFEEPAMAVNKDGDMLIAYGAFPIKAVLSEPECRYNVLYSNGLWLQGARILRKGDAMPTNNKAPVSYADRLDYATAVVDAGDDLTLWVAHSFGDATEMYKMVVGSVKP